MTHAETQLAKESGDVIHEVCKHGCLTISQLIHEVRFACVHACARARERLATARDGSGTRRYAGPARDGLCQFASCDLLRKP